MNPTKLLLTLTLSTGFIFGCQGATDPAETTQAAAPANAEAFTYEIRGMHCEGCVNAIIGKVNKVDGVASCTIDLDSAKAVVVMDPAQTENVTTAISGLGYEVKPMKDS
jgi:copper chaperone CopZ